MKLDANQVAFKKRIGNDGICPVWQIVTKGGYQIVAAVRNGQLDPLALGPHRAIVRHLAKKRCPGIVWTELSKSDEAVDPASPVVASYQALTDAYRQSRGL